MRKYAHIDANQPEIILGLVNLGATVQSLAALGNGAPDLLVGYEGANFAFEVKNPHAMRGKKQGLELTKDEKRWHSLWKGQVHIVTSPQEAIELTLLLRGKR